MIILGWPITLIIVVLVAPFYIGLKLGKKLKSKYLTIISIMYFIVALTVYFILGIFPPSNPSRNLIALFTHLIILSNIAVDVAFLIVYFKKRYAPTHLLLIALLIIVSISIYYFSLPLLSAGTYEKAIVRNTDNVEEAHALTIAENINYSDIFNLPAFTSWDQNEDWGYTWTEFIDANVVEYYDYRFENLKGQPERIDFHYVANVFTWSQIQVVYVPVPKGETRVDDAIHILSTNGSILYTVEKWETSFAYRNNSEYRRVEAEEINFSLPKSYVIAMKLEYDETWAPLAGFGCNVYQTIILDQDFAPFLLCVQSDHYIS